MPIPGWVRLAGTCVRVGSELGGRTDLDAKRGSVRCLSPPRISEPSTPHCVATQLGQENAQVRECPRRESNLRHAVAVAPSISADGRFVAFESQATNLVPGDNNDRLDVFERGPLFQFLVGPLGRSALE